MHQVFTIGELLHLINKEYTNPKALNYYKDGMWHHLSTQEYLQEVKYLVLALKDLGVKKEEKIGLMATSDARWTIIDLAIMASGCVTVPLFPNISEENFQFEVHQPDLKKIFISGIEPWIVYRSHPGLFEHAFDIEDTGQGNLNYSQLLEMGKKIDEENPELYEQILAAAKPDDVVTIIYTSGSTGIPKGAEHTNFSLFSLMHDSNFGFNWKEDTFLSILPLAHVLPRIVNLIMVVWGISIYYFSDPKKLAIAAQEVHPTIITAVPRILEKIYSKMVAAIQKEGYLKRTIAQWAFDLANQEEKSTWKTLFHPIAEKLVYSHLREALGGKIRLVFCGGAPLEPHLNHFFVDIGIPVFEGWGLTEACPLTVNRIGSYKIGTVGLPIDDIKIKTTPEGELLAKGNLLMRGYYKNPEETANVLDADGWLHTGDKGLVDEDGFVTILGRLKEIFKTSTGKMVAPIPIEQALVKAAIIDTALVIADNRKFVSVLIVPDYEIVRSIKNEQGSTDLSDGEFLESEYIKNEMGKLISSVNEHLNIWEQIQAYRFIPRQLTIDAGELTPSMKPRRKVIEQKYKYLIDSIYQKDDV